MNEEETIRLATAMIYRDFELEPSDKTLSPEEVLRLMYRMDIDERLVEAALLPNAPEPANIGLAKLILARQQARARTKQTYRPEDLGEEWEW